MYHLQITLYVVKCTFYSKYNRYSVHIYQEYGNEIPCMIFMAGRKINTLNYVGEKVEFQGACLSYSYNYATL